MDLVVIKILFFIAKIFARHSNNIYSHEIDNLEKEIFYKEKEKE